MSEEKEVVSSFVVQSHTGDDLLAVAVSPSTIAGIIRLVSSPAFRVTTLIALGSEIKLPVKPTAVTGEFTWTYTGILSPTALAQWFGTGKTVNATS